jgi:hypothetical protein
MADTTMDAMLKAIQDLSRLKKELDLDYEKAEGLRLDYTKRLAPLGKLVSELEKQRNEYETIAGRIEERRKQVEEILSRFPGVFDSTSDVPQPGQYATTPLQHYSTITGVTEPKPEPERTVERVEAVTAMGKSKMPREKEGVRVLKEYLMKGQPMTSNMLQKEVERDFDFNPESEDDQKYYRAALAGVTKSGEVVKIKPGEPDFEKIAKAIGAEELMHEEATIYFSPVLMEKLGITRENVVQPAVEVVPQLPGIPDLVYPTVSLTNNLENDRLLREQQSKQKEMEKEAEDKWVKSSANALAKRARIDSRQLIRELEDHLGRIPIIPISGAKKAADVVVTDEFEEWVESLLATELNGIDNSVLKNRFNLAEDAAYVLMGIVKAKLKELGRPAKITEDITKVSTDLTKYRLELG